jgi:hypothetical protein
MSMLGRKNSPPNPASVDFMKSLLPINFFLMVASLLKTK